MAHSYSTLKHWDQWLTQHYLGSHLLQAEEKILSHLLSKHRGKQALLIGVPHQQPLFQSASSSFSFAHTLITPIMSHEKKCTFIDSDLHDLPILTGSIDLVLLPHTLEFVETPRQLLSEACRIIKPEGLIAICGFNPYSLFGVKKLFSKNKTMPWSGNFIPKILVKNWLQLADFAMEDETTILFRPALEHASLYNKLHFLEHVGSICFPPFGGVYVLLARAKVIPLTPIRLKWKQQLSSIKVSTMSGYIARQSK